MVPNRRRLVETLPGRSAAHMKHGKAAIWNAARLIAFDFMSN